MNERLRHLSHLRIARLSWRAIGFLALWMIVAEGDISSLAFGVPTALLAAMLSLALTPERTWRVRLSAIPGFAAYFAAQSISGGVDVALRAIKPSMPLAPGTVIFPLRLPSQAARVFMADVVSLLPGSLSVGLTDDALLIHALDCETDVMGATEQLENQIASLLGLHPLPDPEVRA